MRIIVFAAAAAVSLLASGPGSATYIDFTILPNGYSAGSQGATMAFDGLTVTARTAVNKSSGDPLAPNPPKPNGNPSNNGVAGDVYWGGLGDLGVAGRDYFGLGVLTDGEVGDSTTGPITLSEALIFTFATPQVAQVVGRQLQFTMLGLDAKLNTAGNPVFPADNLRVWFQVASGELQSVDINSGAIGIFGPDYGSIFPWALQYVNFADERIVAFAVEQTYGSATSVRKFGVGSITYFAVPEPATLLLVGAGLGGIGLLGRRRARRRSQIANS